MTHSQSQEEILGLKSNPIIASMVIEIIKRAPNSIAVDAHFHWNLITRDPDDNKFVDCAIVANADFIVSEDKHFKELENVSFPRVVVISLDDFANVFKNISAN